MEIVIKDKARFEKILSAIVKRANKEQAPVCKAITIEGCDVFGCSIVYSNTQASLVMKFDGRVIQDGKAFVNARDLFDLIRSYPQGYTLKSISQDSLDVLENSAYSSIPQLKRDYIDMVPFPHSVNDGIKDVAIITPEQLLKGLKSTAHARANNHARTNIRGSNIGINGKNARFQTTSGHVLAQTFERISSKDPDSIEYKPTTTIPYEETDFLINLLPLVNGYIHIHMEDYSLGFSSKEFGFTSQSQAGAFPNCESVIPKTCNFSIKLEKKELVKVLRSLKKVTKRNDNHAIKLSRDR